MNRAAVVAAVAKRHKGLAEVDVFKDFSITFLRISLQLNPPGKNTTGLCGGQYRRKTGWSYGRPNRFPYHPRFFDEQCSAVGTIDYVRGSGN